MTLNEIFINEAGRLRSGWRFLIFLFLFMLTGSLLGVLTQMALPQLAMDSSLRDLLLISAGSFVFLVLAVLLGWLCGKYLEDLPFRALGAWFTSGWLKDLIFGLIGGALTLGLAVLIAVIFGGLSFDFNHSRDGSAISLTLAASLFVFIIAAAFEEALFRGYILQTFARAQLAWWAIVMTSVFFAASHLGNASASHLSTVNTALAGIWFGAAYLKTRTLWFPFGLHLMWNWFQGAIFGIEVSGITTLTAAPLLKETDAGPVWLTGESYGIEGGIACTIAVLVSILVIWFTPILKPTEEMLALTNEENQKNEAVVI